MLKNITAQAPYVHVHASRLGKKSMNSKGVQTIKNQTSLHTWYRGLRMRAAIDQTVYLVRTAQFQDSLYKSVTRFGVCHHWKATPISFANIKFTVQVAGTHIHAGAGKQIVNF